MKSKIETISYKSDDEIQVEQEIIDLYENCPIPKSQLLENLGLFFDSKNFSRILFMHHIYKQIVNVPGVIMEFGTRWGNNMALFSVFRGIYEPFNRHRKIIGFDTFTGFPSIDQKDGNSNLIQKGNLACTENYYEYIDKIMTIKEKQNPISHIKKYEICVGEASEELENYLNHYPETIIALAYFDFDIYEPTKVCLKKIKNRLVKGSVLAFDELNDSDSPGETAALMEVFDLNNIKLRRLPITSRTSYFVID